MQTSANVRISRPAQNSGGFARGLTLAVSARYEFETDHHHASQDMKVLAPIVDRLITLDCPWWSIERQTCRDILRTRGLIHDRFTATEGFHGTDFCLSEARRRL